MVRGETMAEFLDGVIAGFVILLFDLILICLLFAWLAWKGWIEW